MCVTAAQIDLSAEKLLFKLYSQYSRQYLLLYIISPCLLRALNVNFTMEMDGTFSLRSLPDKAHLHSRGLYKTTVKLNFMQFFLGSLV